jgi:hypothetical protein
MSFAKSLREAADNLRERGLRVIPVNPLKRPMLPEGYQAWDNEKLRRETDGVLSRGLCSAVGVLTGTQDAPFVFDVDLARDGQISGIEWYNKKVQEHGEWKTAQVRSRNGTYHFYCANEPRLHLLSCRNKAIKEDGKIVAVDLKGPGGYVVAPPSFVPPDEGAPGNGRYSWIHPLEGITPMPDWLYDILPKKPEVSEATTDAIDVADIQKVHECLAIAIERLPDKISADYGHWSAIMMCIGGYMKGADDENREKLRAAAHSFSGKCADKYDEREVDGYLERVMKYREVKVTIATVIWYLDKYGGRGWKKLRPGIVKTKDRGLPDGVKPPIITTDNDVVSVKSWIDLLSFTQREGGVSSAFAGEIVPKVAVYVHCPNRYVLYMETDIGTVYPQVFSRSDIKNDHDDIHIVDGKEVGTVELIRKYGRSYLGIRFSVYGECDPRYFNQFTGLQTEYVAGVKREDVAILCDHLRYRIVSDEASYNYITAWLGNLFTCKSRPKVALVIRGKQGNGKSFFWENIILDKIFGVNFAHKFNNIGEALGQFNEVIKGKLFALFDEIGYCPNRDTNDGVKQIISSKYMSINPKGRAAFLCHMYHACVFLTNHIDGIHVAGYARRLACFDASAEECTKEYLNTLLPIEDDIPYISRWMSYCIDFRREHPEIDVNFAPMTSWKALMGISSDSVLSMLIDVCQDEGLISDRTKCVFKTTDQWKDAHNARRVRGAPCSEVVFRNQMSSWCKKGRHKDKRGFWLNADYLEKQVKTNNKIPDFTLSSFLDDGTENVIEYDENTGAPQVADPWQPLAVV